MRYTAQFWKFQAAKLAMANEKLYQECKGAAAYGYLMGHDDPFYRAAHALGLPRDDVATRGLREEFSRMAWKEFIWTGRHA